VPDSINLSTVQRFCS